MQAIVREAMGAGAVGFASSTSPAHNGEGGLPMPSRLASDAEMAALVGAMGEGGRGVYMLTKGGHTPIPFLESLAAATGRPVMVAALLHNSVNPTAVFADLEAIAAANARGHRLLGQVSCCPLSMDFTLASPYPVEGLASWKPALGLAGAALEAVLADKAFRDGGARRAGDADHLSPLQQRMAQGPGGRDVAGRSCSDTSNARSPRSPPNRAATRSTRCSTSPSPTA